MMSDPPQLRAHALRTHTGHVGRRVTCPPVPVLVSRACVPPRGCVDGDGRPPVPAGGYVPCSGADVPEHRNSLQGWMRFAGIVLVVAVLYWAQAVLVPVCLAILLTFVLTPPV